MQQIRLVSSGLAKYKLASSRLRIFDIYALNAKGDTMHNYFLKFAGLVLVVFLLCGCQKSPENDSIISKNDGSFDINVLQTATKPETQEDSMLAENPTSTEEANHSHSNQYNEHFNSTDGTVEFTMNVSLETTDMPMPVVEVTPHYLTGEDAKRVAGVLFGDADFYEAEPMTDEVYSKSEIQEKINRLLNYKGSAGMDVESFKVARDNFIKEYTLKMESAPTENPHTPCQWSFKKESCYFWSEAELANMDISQDNDELQARVKVNGIPYLFTVSTRNKSDFKLNNIYVTIDDGVSPFAADLYIFQNQLCQTSKPDEQSLAKVKAKAVKMLQEMQLGDWRVDECYVEEVNSEEAPQYIIVVNAVPTFEQVPAIRRPQLENLKSKEVYASNYYLSNTQFKFNLSGDLISFEMYSPVDVQSVVNSNVQTLSFDDLMSRAKNYFSLSDYHEYDRIGCLTSGIEDYECMVNISELEYGLTRVKVPNTDESYYYVPAMIFGGAIQFQGKETGEIYDIDPDSTSGIPLVILNAIDGSIINSTNG